MVTTKVAPDARALEQSPPRPASGDIQASEYLLSLVGTVWERSVKGNSINMESASRARVELERIEKQIEQL